MLSLYYYLVHEYNSEEFLLKILAMHSEIYFHIDVFSGNSKTKTNRIIKQNHKDFFISTCTD